MKVTLKANETLEQLQAIIDEGGTHTPREAKRFAELGGGAQAGQSQDARQQKPMSYISNRGTLVKVNRDDKKDYAVPPQEAARLAAPPRGGNQENQEAGTKDVFDMVIQEGDAPGAGPAEWQRAADAEDRTYTRRSMTTKQAHQILERNGINPDSIKSMVEGAIAELTDYQGREQRPQDKRTPRTEPGRQPVKTPRGDTNFGLDPLDADIFNPIRGNNQNQ